MNNNKRDINKLILENMLNCTVPNNIHNNLKKTTHYKTDWLAFVINDTCNKCNKCHL